MRSYGGSVKPSLSWRREGVGEDGCRQGSSDATVETTVKVAV